MILQPNKESRSSSVHDARVALGKRLRELRVEAGLSGKQLAASLSWQASKVSKLENGRQTPSDDDIRAWTRATGRDVETDGLLASLHTLEVQYAEWRRLLRAGVHNRQSELGELDQRTRFFRVFEATVVPGLLQTAEYARYRFADAIRVLRLETDLDAAVAGRMKRQDMFYRPDKRFHFVLTEAALRFRLCPPEVMLGQLDRLVSLSALPNVKLGIVGFETTYTTAPWHGFWIFDDDHVAVETYSAGLKLAQPHEIELYSGVFKELATVASYGRAARNILTRVIDDVAAEATDSE
ncbi:helix-turn-helix transcriptional regulator [Amycolatopsis sp.]|uniref:helix-turn-helix domain-containing protein n=1 Tax=Amycolatopsis sp. TaxID=37632 RepID=UPI002C277BED|nr:helix-turn-helix transcriptional regulator [Amycolatopsis sp.]HVV12468.1 helix-turn-helix transcriptional regulator [Amycolatopsis sp.]